MSRINPRVIVALFAFAAIIASPLFAKPMPEFGGSIEYSPSSPKFKLADLKGKGALVMFFQSWCPKCNEWSGDLFKQITAAHGDNRKVALIAIKTDGGGTAGATSYLKARGVDTTKWHVLADNGAAYYKQINPKTGLYNYALVGTDGNVIETAYAASFYPGRKFVLAQPGVLAKIGDAKSVLPEGKTYLPELSVIVRAAEVCDLGTALKYCNLAARKSALKDDALALKADLEATIDARVTALIASLGSDDMAVKYEAYVSLANLAPKIGTSSESGKKARAALSAAKKDKAIKAESLAHKAYKSVAAKAARATPQQAPLVAKAFASVAKRYPETIYGKLAAEEAASLK